MFQYSPPRGELSGLEALGSWDLGISAADWRKLPAGVVLPEVKGSARPQMMPGTSVRSWRNGLSGWNKEVGIKWQDPNLDSVTSHPVCVFVYIHIIHLSKTFKDVSFQRYMIILIYRIYSILASWSPSSECEKSGRCSQDEVRGM